MHSSYKVYKYLVMKPKLILKIWHPFHDLFAMRMANLYSLCNNENSLLSGIAAPEIHRQIIAAKEKQEPEDDYCHMLFGHTPANKYLKIRRPFLDNAKP